MVLVLCIVISQIILCIGCVCGGGGIRGVDLCGQNFLVVYCTVIN